MKNCGKVKTTDMCQITILFDEKKNKLFQHTFTTLLRIDHGKCKFFQFFSFLEFVSADKLITMQKKTRETKRNNCK